MVFVECCDEISNISDRFEFVRDKVRLLGSAKIQRAHPTTIFTFLYLYLALTLVTRKDLLRLRKMFNARANLFHILLKLKVYLNVS